MTDPSAALPAWHLDSPGAKRFRVALKMLLEAFNCGASCQRRAAEVTIGQAALRKAGLTDALFHALLATGLTIGVPSAGKFKAVRVALTEPGAAFATAAPGLPNGTVGVNGKTTQTCAVKPSWKEMLRELWFEGGLVKRYGRTAENQELVLAAFQEEHCARRIDDPLTRSANIDPPTRLGDVLKRLNSTQSVLRFHADNNGTGIRWEARR